MKMIDLHCHILYDIDDGAKTKEDSAALLHTAVQNEIKAIIATPVSYTHLTLPTT